jgi:hypothetical protein
MVAKKNNLELLVAVSLFSRTRTKSPTVGASYLAMTVGMAHIHEEARPKMNAMGGRSRACLSMQCRIMNSLSDQR